MDDLARHWIRSRDYLRLSTASVLAFGALGLLAEFLGGSPPSGYVWVVVVVLFMIEGWVIATWPWIKNFGIRDDRYPENNP